MATRYPKQLSSDEQTNDLLEQLAKIDQQAFYLTQPNESFTIRRLVKEEAIRKNLIASHSPTPKQKRARAAQKASVSA